MLRFTLSEVSKATGVSVTDLSALLLVGEIEAVRTATEYGQVLQITEDEVLRYFGEGALTRLIDSYDAPDKPRRHKPLGKRKALKIAERERLKREAGMIIERMVEREKKRAEEPRDKLSVAPESTEKE